MGALTERTPKPLLRVHARPILEHILLGLRAAGVDHAVIVTGYLGHQIEAYLADGRELGLRLEYRHQDTPDGTARALLLARNALAEEPFVLSWGDIIVPTRHYARIVATYQADPCDALLSLNHVDDPWRGAAVYVDEAMRVSDLIEKPPRGSSTTTWNNAGVFVFDPIVLDYAARLPRSARGEFELPQALTAMISDGRNVRALPVDGYWSDLGTPEDLAAAEAASW